jgi:hypothetical protein
MLVYVQCFNGDKEFSVAINPNHVVAIIEIEANDLIKYNSRILTVTGVEYHSTENYLDLVGRFNSSL